MRHTASQEIIFPSAFRALDSTGIVRWHGHNFTLRASLEGPLSSDGVILPAYAMSDWLAAAIAPYEHASLDSAGQEPSVALASLASQLHQRLSASTPPGATLASITLSHPALGVTRCGGRTLFRFPGEFSAAHRTHAPLLSAAENYDTYGICNNPAGHGHNYRATIWHPQPDAVPSEVWTELDHRNLSIDLPDLLGRNVVTETIAARLGHRAPGVARVRVWETPAFFAEWWPTAPHFRLGRHYSFSAAHQLASSLGDGWDAQALYGPCGRAGIHGHDFRVLIVVTGELDDRTETAFDLGDLDRLAVARLAPLHHANLSADIARLAGAATPAVLAHYLFALIHPDLGSALWAVGVSATPSLWSWTAKGTHG